MRKLTVLLVVIGALLVGLSEDVRAGAGGAAGFVGMMCINTDACSRCEVCVKEHQTDPTGKCMAIAGCL